MHAPAFKGFRWRKCNANSNRARPSSLTYVTSVNAGVMALFLDRSMSLVVCSSSGLIPSRSITKGIWTRRSVLLSTAQVACVLPWQQMCCRNWGTRMWLTWRWGMTLGKKPVAPGRKCLFPASYARDKERQYTYQKQIYKPINTNRLVTLNETLVAATGFEPVTRGL